MSEKVDKLHKKALDTRKKVLDMCVRAKTGHVTSSMSCIDILIALYHGGILKHNPQNPAWEERDRFILSKGQASPALYAVLASCGYFDSKELNKFAQKGGMFGVHLQNNVPGVEITSGSLAQGFGLAAGIALGAKMNRDLYLVFTMLGDGECYEGAIWETALFAAHNRLNNLIAILDRNYLCVTDFTENLIALEPFEEKWNSFGWDVLRIDGHSFEEMFYALCPLRSRKSHRPIIIIADTVKGKGIDSLCHQPLWHGLAPDAELAKKAVCELEGRFSDNE